MSCELLPNSEDSCLLTSPQNVPNDTVTTSCMRVDYELSSDDVVLTALIFFGGTTAVSNETFNADRKISYIDLSDLPSTNFTVTFSATRSVTSAEKMQSARIVEVQLQLCSDSGLCCENL